MVNTNMLSIEHLKEFAAKHLNVSPERIRVQFKQYSFDWHDGTLNLPLFFCTNLTCIYSDETSLDLKLRLSDKGVFFLSRSLFELWLNSECFNLNCFIDFVYLSLQTSMEGYGVCMSGYEFEVI